MARSNFPAEAETKPAAPRSRPVSERPSTRPTVPAPSGRYKVAAAAEPDPAPLEPALREAPPLPDFASFPKEEAPVMLRDAAAKAAAALATTVRPMRYVRKPPAREEYAPRKRDPREEE